MRLRLRRVSSKSKRTARITCGPPFPTCEVPAKKEVEDAIAEAKKSLEGTDIDAIKAAGEKLTAASQKLAQVVYSATQDATAAGADAAPSDDDVVDADYEVVDDDKDNK